MHALLCRNWKSREKGRDYYDYVWYLSENTPLNIKHLEARMRQTGHWKGENSLTLDLVKEMLYSRFEKKDYQEVKQDVMPFISDPTKLDVWSKEFFIAITKEHLQAM